MQLTSIAWTNYSSNPLYALQVNGKRGWFCHKVSPGCKNCYAEELNLRLGMGLAFQESSDVECSLVLNSREFDAWFNLKTPSMIFVEDMGDIFLELVSDEWLDEIFRAMIRCKWHVFQLLTKRPERMLEYMEHFEERFGPPTQNIWMGVSVESWPFKDRIDVLRSVPCWVRFVSFEPLLDSVLLGTTPERRHPANEAYGVQEGLDLSSIDWAIVGGESGKHYRSMNLDWAREIREECQKQKVAFFFKQSSGRYSGTDPTLDGKRHHEFPHWDSTLEVAA